MAKGKRKNPKESIGEKFGKLTVLSIDTQKPKGETWMICECECGNTKSIRLNSLRCGKSTSCGCAKGNNKHNKTNSRLYRIWNGMKNRCNNPNSKDFERYGGRGICINEEWNDDFTSFYEWAIDNGYEDNLTIDRINFDNNYSEENCRWVNIKTQDNNKSNNIIIEYNNEYLTLKQLSEKININYQTLFGRYRKGDRGNVLTRPIDEIKSTRGK